MPPLKIHITRQFGGFSDGIYIHGNWESFTISAIPIYPSQQRKYVQMDVPTPTRVLFDIRLE
jgi:hypothetical protein